MLSEVEYVEKDGLACPVCKGRDLAIGDLNIDTTLVTVPVECENCGATWEDVYTLTGYTKLVEK